MSVSWGTHAHLVAALKAVSQVDAFTRSCRQIPVKMLFFANLLYGKKNLLDLCCQVYTTTPRFNESEACNECKIRLSH